MVLPRISVTEELIAENKRLKSVLGFRDRNRYGMRLLPAQVIGKGSSPWFSILETNRGASSGIKVDMPVVVEEGLVGRVAEVSQFSSKVLLITDATSSVAAADQRSRDFGVVEGRSSDALFMKYVPASGDISEGDKIVTSPISSVFPAGIPIGIVSRAEKKEHDLFYRIEVKPFVKFSQLEEVFLVF